MLFLNWQRALQSTALANILRNIPIDAQVVENTSYHHGETAIFWGAKNMELKQAREIAEAEVAINGVFRYKKDLAFAQMLAANKINNVGTFVGRNVMGKIIKICSLSLIYGQEPPIDYNLLMSKDLFMIGKRIEFPFD
jgi:hypothetical protein